MYPKIYNTSEQELATLNNITSNKLTRRINNKYVFDFTCFEEVLKTEYITHSNLILADNDYFDINYIDVSHDYNGKVVYDVKCEHVFYRLLDTELNNYANTGTPTAILTDLLSGTDFSVGTVDFTEEVVFAVNQNTNKMAIIIALANQLGAEIDFSNNGFTIDLLDGLGQDNNYEIRIKKNLKGINKISDRRGENKLTYKFNLVDIFKSEQYKDLEDLETVGIGDTIYAIDDVIDVDTTQVVYEISKDVIKSKTLDIVTGDNFDTLADETVFLQQTAIKQGDIIYGVKINNDLGIEIERDDQLARTKLNADEFKMQTGDGAGNYTDALYFDPIDEKYIFVGELNASDIVGGTIVIADDFEVDSNGHMTATNATFTGTITGTSISGGTITGTTFKTASSGQRIEISGNELNTYNSNSNKEGFQIVAPDGFNYSMAQLWSDGQLQLEFFNSGGSSEGYGIRPRNGKSLGIGTNGVLTEFSGDIDINNASELKIPVISSASVPSPEEGLIFIVEDFSNGPSIIFACDDGSGSQRWFTTQQGIPY